jgi:hypothetical protein
MLDVECSAFDVFAFGQVAVSKHFSVCGIRLRGLWCEHEANCLINNIFGRLFFIGVGIVHIRLRRSNNTAE